MRFVPYSGLGAGGGSLGLMTELLDLIKNGSDDAQYAGLYFLEAIKLMMKRNEVMAREVEPRIIWMHLFQPTVSLRARYARKYSLYLTRIADPGPPQDIEVRLLLACNGIDPERIRAQQAAERHHSM